MNIIPFFEFCPKVLRLHLTPGQRVIAKIAFGDADPIDLEGEERELALQMFGGLERIPQAARKYILLRLGRGSGKTTLCAAFAVYIAVTFDVTKCGPGDTPYVIVVAPDKETAKLSIRMAREMIRSSPAIERLVVGDESQVITLRRPDGRQVKIESFAASRGGSSMRGRSIMAFIMDEAEFFTSNGGIDQARNYSVNDKDIFDAMKPRLMPSGKGMLISTPWPVETLMGKMFDENWGNCRNAAAIKAPTLLVRGDDPDVKAMVEDELTRDLENARRELFCELEGVSGGEFFDINALQMSLDDQLKCPIGYNPGWPVAIGCDMGFTRDSSAIAVVQWDGRDYRTCYLEEMHPNPGKPLKPSEVIAQFAKIAKLYGKSGVIADSYYREALKEQLNEHGLVVFEAPEGVKGKAEVFQRVRSVMNEGKVKIPDVTVGRRLVQQARLVVSRPTPGGTTTIRIPRKIGMGHGDLVSAWSLAVHRLAYAQLERKIPVYEPGTPEWFNESQRRMYAWVAKQQDDYLKETEKEVKKGLSARRLKDFNKVLY